METAVSKLLSILPTPVAAVLMLGGVIFYVLGCVRQAAVGILQDPQGQRR